MYIFFFHTFFVSDDLTGRKGGELASAVHAYTKTGDPYMRSLVQHILGLVSHPVLNFLYRWIYDGELEDTYHEVILTYDIFHLFICFMGESVGSLEKNWRNKP